MYLIYVFVLKVSKFQKQIILFSILPKNERKTSILVARILGEKFFVQFLGKLRAR